MIKFDVLNTISGNVQFTAEIECTESAARAFKLRLAIEWAINAGANLVCANLRGADLKGASLNSAHLEGANLEDADLEGANLRGAYLDDANLEGANLEDANLSGVDLERASLKGANLRGANLKGANLRDADLEGTNLRDADLRDADFKDASLKGANLEGANIEGASLKSVNLRGASLKGTSLKGADLRGATLREIPTIKNIHQSVYSAASQPDALDMSRWHTCDTTHCRAGWVTTLAGNTGVSLEEECGTDVAAALIYFKSDPTLERVPDFYATDEEALADMKAMAEAEAARAVQFANKDQPDGGTPAPDGCGDQAS